MQMLISALRTCSSSTMKLVIWLKLYFSFHIFGQETSIRITRSGGHSDYSTPEKWYIFAITFLCRRSSVLLMHLVLIFGRMWYLMGTTMSLTASVLTFALDLHWDVSRSVPSCSPHHIQTTVPSEHHDVITSLVTGELPTHVEPKHENPTQH